MPIHHCPVCGFGPLGVPYRDEHVLTGSFDICSCCGCEYGYDDSEAHYQRWSDSGFPWFEPELKPLDWNISSQLAHQIRPWPPSDRLAMTELVEKWICYHRDKCKPSDPLFAAWEEVDEIIHSDGDGGWTLLLQLIDAAPDDRVLAAVAAGPLEDLLDRISDEQIELVEVEARRSPKFRRCLTGVRGLAPRFRECLAKYFYTVKDPL